MSKYIDADLYVEMQVYDDEHEEWSWWKGTIEELLDQWTEEGCPSTIEVSEDCISREWLLNYTHAEDVGTPDEMWKPAREWVNAIKNAPSVTTEQSSMVGEWVESEIPNELYVCSECGGACWSYDWDRTIVKSYYCPNCGAKMKG